MRTQFDNFILIHLRKNCFATRSFFVIQFLPLKTLLLFSFLLSFGIKCVLCKRSFCVSNSNKHRLSFFFFLLWVIYAKDGAPLSHSRSTLSSSESGLARPSCLQPPAPQLFKKNFSFSTKLCFPITCSFWIHFLFFNVPYINLKLINGRLQP